MSKWFVQNDIIDQWETSRQSAKQINVQLLCEDFISLNNTQLPRFISNKFMDFHCQFWELAISTNLAGALG